MAGKGTAIASGWHGGVTRRRVLAAGLLGAGAMAIGSSPAAAQEARTSGARTGEEIARTGLRYKGSPYVAGGSSPRGFDCSGFTRYVVEKVTGRDIGPTVEGQWGQGTRVSLRKLRAGDLLFFENTYRRGLSHVGIHLGNGRFVHAENEDTGGVIDDLRSDYYGSRYVGARRMA